MRELPRGWVSAKLAALAAPEAHALTDGPFGSNLKSSDYVVDGPVRVIRLGNIGVGRFLDDDRAFVTREKFEGLRKHEAREGDIVIAALAEPVGRATRVPRHVEPAIVKADCVRLRVRKGVDATFVTHALNSPQGLKQAEETAHGVGRLRINLGEMRALEVPLPPLNEQRRIVAKLEALQERSRRAREALDAIPPLLEKLRQSILAAAFRGDLTREWRARNPDVEPASELLKRIRVERRRKWEEAELAKMIAKGRPPKDDKWKADYKAPRPVDTEGLHELPEGWCWASVEEAGELLLGRRRAAEEYREGHDGRVMRAYVRVANVKRDRLELDDVLEMPFNEAELRLYRLEPGDIILSEGQSLELVGQSAMFRGGFENLCIQATVHRFRARSGVLAEYAQLVFLHHLMTGVFRRAASITTNIAHLTSERLRPLQFPLAPLAEQEAIVAGARGRLTALQSLGELVSRMRQPLASFDRSLLAKAFRGELVPQDPNDEPVVLPTAAPPTDEPAPRARRRPAARAKTTRRRASR